MAVLHFTKRVSHLCRYGAILEKFQKQDSSLMGRVKGCIVDSAPVAAADPTVSDDSCIHSHVYMVIWLVLNHRLGYLIC